MLNTILYPVFFVYPNIDECKVDDPGNDSGNDFHGHDCIFPFFWDGKKYYKCTDVNPFEKWPCRVWCATEVKSSTDKLQSAQRGVWVNTNLLTINSWGYCSTQCPFKCKLKHL